MAHVEKREGRKLPFLVGWRDPATKKMRWKSFKLRRDAEEYCDTVSTELRQGTYVDRRPLPVKTYATDWLTRTQPTVTDATHALHEWAVNNYIIPAFNLMAIQALLPDRLERWQADLLRVPTLGPRSVQIIRTTLTTILEDARDKGYLFRNPMEKVKKFDVPERPLSFLLPAQVKALCETVGRFYGMLFLVMAFCGLRIGEATGLQPADLDLVQGLLFVRRQVVWRRKNDLRPGEPRWAFRPPKSKAGVRVVQIPAPMCPLLAAHLESLAGHPNPLGLVFPSETGTPLDRRNVRRRHFVPAMKALRIAGVRQHDLRRSFIFVHVQAGTHPKVVQEQVGHGTFKLTWDVYGKMAGKAQLSPEQKTRFDGIATASLPKEIPETCSPPDDAPDYRQERLMGRQLGPKPDRDGEESECEEK